MVILRQDLLKVAVFPNRQSLGTAAAGSIASTMKRLLSEKESINMVFGAAPSQDETLDGLALDSSIDWSRVRVFHMDEYVGLDIHAPQSFGRYLHERLFDKVKPREVFLIDGCAVDKTKECDRYARLLEEYPTDIVCLGIGENTHIAFNDPHIADFSDPSLVKVVTLDEQCRLQQVNDGCFPSINSVPRQAITLTVPALVRAAYAFCMVPGKRKAKAVFKTLTVQEITAACPASILREHPDACLFLDADSSSEIVELYDEVARLF
jgi:glucosamine-6-phosphate deaminase